MSAYDPKRTSADSYPDDKSPLRDAACRSLNLPFIELRQAAASPDCSFTGATREAVALARLSSLQFRGEGLRGR
jgi:hypothetical protein